MWYDLWIFLFFVSKFYESVSLSTPTCNYDHKEKSFRWFQSNEYIKRGCCERRIFIPRNWKVEQWSLVLIEEDNQNKKKLKSIIHLVQWVTAYRNYYLIALSTWRCSSIFQLIPSIGSTFIVVEGLHGNDIKLIQTWTEFIRFRIEPSL